MNVDDFLMAGRKLAKGKVARDGEIVKVHLSMMDGVDPAALAALHSLKDTGSQAMHRPGQLAMTDTDRLLSYAARETRIARMTDAWRSPAQQQPNASLQTDNKPDAMAAYAARSARLRDAWKGGQ